MTETEYIGIDDKRLAHSLSVARKAYRLSVEDGHSESFCRAMFVAGFLHDIGYEFSETATGHSNISANLIEDFLAHPECIDAIRNHGDITEDETCAHRILVYSDMTTDRNGNDVSVKERLAGISARYGAGSETHAKCEHVCRELGLLQ